jgi:hypothetical protein
MKQILFFVLLLFHVLSAEGQSSIYHPFPDSNAAWNFNFSDYCFSNGTGNENYSIILSGDTSINKRSYHILAVPFIQSFSTGSCTGNVSTGYNGAIRQDIKNKKCITSRPKTLLSACSMILT